MPHASDCHYSCCSACSDTSFLSGVFLLKLARSLTTTYPCCLSQSSWTSALPSGIFLDSPLGMLYVRPLTVYPRYLSPEPELRSFSMLSATSGRPKLRGCRSCVRGRLSVCRGSKGERVPEVENRARQMPSEARAFVTAFPRSATQRDFVLQPHHILAHFAFVFTSNYFVLTLQALFSEICLTSTSRKGTTPPKLCPRTTTLLTLSRRWIAQSHISPPT